MKIAPISKQQGVFAIEFALGFIVLFMFTVLIFEVCRLTYICSVLDYASAEAARDARVQMHKNSDFEKYREKNCTDLSDPIEIQRCKHIQSFSGDQFAFYFEQFVHDNGGKLWEVFTSKKKMEIKASHYKSLDDLDQQRINTSWKQNAISEYQLTYHYTPIFFKWSFTNTDITRHVLVISEFERLDRVK
ncbi:TadE/TadG family type IV pilus assembly protein [Vibrio tapetis]|uniref:TadE-like domain-containing protein n=1 Tax=Vibrio tapetis subsp. tapetis TaxID=1671868 RepID=A0A2N8ZD09_9VIBR|nr:TadE family protein [Vibrio tapetis]SON49787.1 protein of unknown function [Vibrio tapetis subsp. tapetis]